MAGSSSMPPLETSGGWGWVRGELRTKADHKWVEAKVEDLTNRILTLEKGTNEAKEIGLSAKRQATKPHACNQETTLSNIEVRIGSWTSWWRGMMVSVIVAIIIGAAAIVGWLYSHRVLKGDVDTLKVNMQKIETSQEKLTTAFQENKVIVEQRDAEQIKEVRGAFRAVVEEMKADGFIQGRKKRRKSGN